MKKLMQIFTAIFIFVSTTVFSPPSPAYSLEAQITKELKDNCLNLSMDWGPHTHRMSVKVENLDIN